MFPCNSKDELSYLHFSATCSSSSMCPPFMSSFCPQQTGLNVHARHLFHMFVTQGYLTLDSSPHHTLGWKKTLNGYVARAHCWSSYMPKRPLYLATWMFALQRYILVNLPYVDPKLIPFFLPILVKSQVFLALKTRCPSCFPGETLKIHDLF